MQLCLTCKQIYWIGTVLSQAIFVVEVSLIAPSLLLALRFVSRTTKSNHLMYSEGFMKDFMILINLSHQI
jgi:hypothetical protein